MQTDADNYQSAASAPGVPDRSRRNLLKVFVGLPVLGALGFSFFRENRLAAERKKGILQALGLENLAPPNVLFPVVSGGGRRLRLGIIGFGSRGYQLANALGYMLPDHAAQLEQAHALEAWMLQEDLEVDVTGICDVFDMHAERGLKTISGGIRSGGSSTPAPQVKRYLRYTDMLADAAIDAVLIATPDHHHAQITMDAVRAGKHVYCEKSLCLTESELNEVYDTVRNGKVVFQLGHQYTQNAVFAQAREVIRKGILGNITLVETNTNRNTADGAWIRHIDRDGKAKPGDEQSIDWKQWLGNAPFVPFSIERFYSWTKYFDYDTGLIGQLFTHEYDAVNQLMRIGIPHSAVASGGIYFWKDDRDMADTLHCTFEYPERNMTLTYSANLANSKGRGRLFMGHDASMELDSGLTISVDRDSTRYRSEIDSGALEAGTPMITVNPGSGSVDAVTSATEKYYASRGLTTTNINGRIVDTTHLHVREWINCIRTGAVPSANIERAFEEGVTCLMAHRSYVEKRRVEWDPVARRIV